MTRVDEAWLKHYGVLGMHWGVRRGSSGSRGGFRKPGSPEHERKIQLKGKRLKNMSNSEIKELTGRLQLESAYRKATAKPKSKLRKIAEGIAKDLGDEAGKAVKAKIGAEILKRAMKFAAKAK